MTRPAAVRADRPLVVRGLTDPGSMRDIIWPAFRDSVAPDATLDYAQDVVGARLLAAIRAVPEDERPTVLFVSGPAAFDRAGLIEPFDIDRADRIPEGWRDPGRRWQPTYVQPIVVVHNSHHVTAPRRWTDLADGPPDRLVFDDPARMFTTGPALAELSSTMDESAWEAFVRGLGARRPQLSADNERAVLEVATGSRWHGLSNWNVARRVRPGSPVRHTFLAPTPLVPGFGILVRGAPNAALGRRFLAWLGTEAGQRAYAATGRIPSQPDVDASPSLREVLPPGIEPLFGSTDWLTDPDRWAARFRELMPADREIAREGKMR